MSVFQLNRQHVPLQRAAAARCLDAAEQNAGGVADSQPDERLVRRVQTTTAMKQKKDDPEIQYQYRPHGDQRCGVCSMFRPPNQCSAVAGPIVSHGWCKIFQAQKKP